MGISPQKTTQNALAVASTPLPTNPSPHAQFNPKENFMMLRSMLLKVLKSKPARYTKFGDEMSDPAAQPMVWVSKWVDYSDKYGFGYQLSDESMGVMFNDTTKLIMLPNGVWVPLTPLFQVARNLALFQERALRQRERGRGLHDDKHLPESAGEENQAPVVL